MTIQETKLLLQNRGGQTWHNMFYKGSCKHCIYYKIAHVINSFIFWIVTPDKEMTTTTIQTNHLIRQDAPW